MRLTQTELYVLRTAHGNTHACQGVRSKLRDAGYKYCAGCHSVLESSEFHKAPKCRTADGLQNICRACHLRSKRSQLTPKRAKLAHHYLIYRPERGHHSMVYAECDRAAHRACYARRKRAA